MVFRTYTQIRQDLLRFMCESDEGESGVKDLIIYQKVPGNESGINEQLRRLTEEGILERYDIGSGPEARYGYKLVLH